MMKWRIDLTVTETDDTFEYRFQVIKEFGSHEVYANHLLDKYVKHFEEKGYTVGGGLVKVDE